MAASLRAANAKRQMLPGNPTGADASTSSFGLGRILPKVSTDPIAPPAEEIAMGPIVSAANQSSNGTDEWSQPKQANLETQLASYGSSYATSAVPPPPAGALGGSLVPPPPAVTLSTQAQTAYAAPAENPYGNPYFNPYGVPYPTTIIQQMAPPAASERPPGSPFASGGRGSKSDDGDDVEKQKKTAAPFLPITPSGMEPRSVYKQRDDLKVLWKGLLASSKDVTAIVTDAKIADQLNKIDVALPAEATKGSFGVPQRTVEGIFKANNVDKRILPTVHKLETDLVQAYYRYLYCYNKFALAQQTILARKQEAEVAGSPSESQRAAADLAAAQTEAESSKDDMHSAQAELAALTGASAARTVIGRISGVTPTLESLTANDQSDAQGKSGKAGHSKVIASVESLFHLRRDKAGEKPAEKEATAPKVEESAAKGDSKGSQSKSDTKVAKAEPKTDKKKQSENKEDNNAKAKGGADLSPAPNTVAKTEPSPQAPEKSHTSGATNNSDITFQLKGISVTPRKSTLTVSIHNLGTNSFSFSPDVISISDGNHKLSDATVRADFDQTQVQPNQEVKGTITIFGRPWNDRLAVVLTDGGKNIQMRR